MIAFEAIFCQMNESKISSNSLREYSLLSPCVLGTLAEMCKWLLMCFFQSQFSFASRATIAIASNQMIQNPSTTICQHSTNRLLIAPAIWVYSPMAKFLSLFGGKKHMCATNAGGGCSAIFSSILMKFDLMLFIAFFLFAPVSNSTPIMQENCKLTSLNSNSQVSTQSRENCPQPFLGLVYHSTDSYELNNLTELLSHYTKLKPE